MVKMTSKSHDQEEHAPDTGRVSGGESGFVLFAVLVAIVALSALAVWITGRATSDAQTLSVEASLLQARNAADAGLQRVLAALADQEDSLRRGLSPYAPGARWTFGSADLRLRVRAESGKVDVLVGNRQLLGLVVRATISDAALADEILGRIDRLRQGGAVPESLIALFPPALRLGDTAHILDDHLTLVANQGGVDPLAATPLVRGAILALYPGLDAAMAQSVENGLLTADLAAGLGAMISQQRPLYTIDAQASLPNGIRSRRSALVTLDSAGRSARIERMLDLPPTDE